MKSNPFGGKPLKKISASLPRKALECCGFIHKSVRFQSCDHADDGAFSFHSFSIFRRACARCGIEAVDRAPLAPACACGVGGTCPERRGADGAATRHAGRSAVAHTVEYLDGAGRAPSQCGVRNADGTRGKSVGGPASRGGAKSLRGGKSRSALASTTQRAERHSTAANARVPGSETGGRAAGEDDPGQAAIRQSRTGL